MSKNKFLFAFLGIVLSSFVASTIFAPDNADATHFGAPSGLSPSGYVNNPPLTFSWSDEGAEAYVVSMTVGGTPRTAFTTGTPAANSVPRSAFAPVINFSDLVRGQSYTWDVQSCHSTFTSCNTSFPTTFSIKYNSPTITFPVSNATDQSVSSNSFLWTAPPIVPPQYRWELCRVAACGFVGSIIVDSLTTAGNVANRTWSPNLQNGTDYWWRVGSCFDVACTAAGIQWSGTRKFTTIVGAVVAPTVTNASASSVMATTATLNASSSSSEAGTAWFRYGTVASGFPATCTVGMTSGTVTATTLIASGPDTFSVNISGLTASTDYRFCPFASNSGGTGVGGTGMTTNAGAFTTSASGGVCGDLTKNGSEECDGIDFGAVSDCVDLGYSSGPLSCNPPGPVGCTFNTSMCVGAPPPPACAAPASCVTTGTCSGSVVAGSCAVGTECCDPGAPPPPTVPLPTVPAGSTTISVVIPNPLTCGTLADCVNNIIDFLFTVAVIVAPILLVIAGVIFMTAAGDPGRVATARRMLLWTIVGFGIILLSKGLVTVLKAVLGVP